MGHAVTPDSSWGPPTIPKPLSPHFLSLALSVEDSFPISPLILAPPRQKPLPWKPACMSAWMTFLLWSWWVCLCENGAKEVWGLREEQDAWTRLFVSSFLPRGQLGRGAVLCRIPQLEIGRFVCVWHKRLGKRSLFFPWLFRLRSYQSPREAKESNNWFLSHQEAAVLLQFFGREALMEFVTLEMPQAGFAPPPHRLSLIPAWKQSIHMPPNHIPCWCPSPDKAMPINFLVFPI